VTVAPETRAVVFTCERSLRAVDLDSCDERPLIDDAGPEWIFGAPAVSPDEKWAAVPLSSAHPDILAGRPVSRPYTSFPDHRLRLLRVPLAGEGEPEVLFERQPAQSAHCACCPTDPDLLYFDLDLPPGYWGGGDGATPRIWLLDLGTGEARPLKSDYPGPFQTHTAWLWDGSALAYHGSLPGGGTYVGLTNPSGKTLWERSFPEATFYGHLTPDARRPALIIDGDFSRDTLQWLYYDTDANKRPQRPRLEPIARHNTEWGSLPGQYSHPHPLTDAAGKWVSFTAARDGRSDVFAVAP
jgi:hypothetical protein